MRMALLQPTQRSNAPVAGHLGLAQAQDVVQVALSSLARSWGDHSLPACVFFFPPQVETSSRTLIHLDARISPQWLRELRRLWPNVP